MKLGGNKKDAVEEAVRAIQQVTVKRLRLDMKPVELDPNLDFMGMEVVRYGQEETLDSLDLVNVISVLEDALERLDESFEEDLVAEFRDWLEEKEGEKRFSIENMAEFLVERFELDRRRVRKLAKAVV